MRRAGPEFIWRPPSSGASEAPRSPRLSSALGFFAVPYATPTSPLVVRPAACTAHRINPLQATVSRLFGVTGLSDRAILTALGVALFVDVLIVTLEAAAIWSVAGLLHLPATATIVMTLSIFVPAKWLCWYVARLSLEAEARGDDVPAD